MKPNPFPGMNPWLEQHWGDVHTRLTTYASDMLQPGLPAGLRARVEEYLTVQQQPDEEPLTHRRMQIIDTRSRNRVVTSIEFLSPTNKRIGADDFVRKQHLKLHGGTNIVEIDLLRGDCWVSTIDRDAIPKSRRTRYRVCVITAQRPNRGAVYSIALRQPLPILPIPLRPTDQDVPLNLQALIDQTYINGGYEDVDYTQPPKPPLNESDAQWAAQVLKEHGLL